MDTNKITLRVIKELYANHNYPMVDGVNICGIRSNSLDSNTFDDVIIVFDRERFHVASATTDPGHYYRNNPANVKGTAILPIGFHKDIWSMGMHRGKYEALVQRHACRVIRDDDRDNLINYTIPPDAICTSHIKDNYYNYHIQWNNGVDSKDGGLYVFRKDGVDYTVEVGYFGINLHRARNRHNDATVVDKFSAGCQVIQSYGDWLVMLGFIREFNNHHPTGSFNYALFTEMQMLNIV